MINWDLIDSLLRKTRPDQNEPYRVAIYSRMPYADGQEAIAATHIKFMKIAINRDTRFHLAEVHADYGIKSADLMSMLEYRRIIERCKAGKIDLVMIHDISRIAKDRFQLIKNLEPLSDCHPEIGLLSLADCLLVMSGDAVDWAEKMASGNYTACRLPYYTGFIPQPPTHCET